MRIVGKFFVTFFCLPLLLTAPKLSAQQAEFGPRFSSERPAVEQLAEMASALSVPEQGVSRAIAEGRLNPNLDDLYAAYFDIGYRSCDDLWELRVEDLRASGAADDAAASERRYFEAYRNIYCRTYALNLDRERIDAWNARFGGKPDGLSEHSHTVVAHFLRNDRNTEAYLQLRCDFFAGAMDRFGHTAMPRECAGVTLTVRRAGNDAQMEAARRSDVFGPANDKVSYRIRLFADGAFDALDAQAAEDWARYTSTIGEPFWERTLTSTRQGPKYDHLVAAYATARLAILGDCGERTTRLVATGGAVTDYRVGSTTVRTLDNRYAQEFDALRRFAPVIQRTNFQLAPGFSGSTAVLRDFGPVFKELRCNSPERKLLEDNLIAYVEREEPPHKR